MSNYKYVKNYESKQKEKGLKRQKAWIPDTDEDKKSFLNFAKQLRDNFLSKQSN